MEFLVGTGPRPNSLSQREAREVGLSLRKKWPSLLSCSPLPSRLITACPGPPNQLAWKRGEQNFPGPASHGLPAVFAPLGVGGIPALAVAPRI